MSRCKYLYAPPKTLFIPVGTPLMGKTTWVKKTLPYSVASISRDGIRDAISRKVSLGIGKFYETITDSKMENHIEHLWWISLEWNMKRGVPIVVDTTNLTRKGRYQLCATAHRHGYHTVVVVFALRSSLKECLFKDVDIIKDKAKYLYKQAQKVKHPRQYREILNEIDISSHLCQTLLIRNFLRFKQEYIFINLRVLSAMIKRMYTDYPTRAYLSWEIRKIMITHVAKPCTQNKLIKTNNYKGVAKPPSKPTLEGKEW